MSLIQPLDENKNAIPLPPASTALAVTTDDTISSSTEITLNALTTIIEVNALDYGVFLKWGADDATSSAYDEYILPNSVRHFVKPKSATKINVIQDGGAAKVRIIEK